MEPQLADLAAVRRALMRWHRAHGMHAPWRDSGDAYETMIAAVMAQQTQVSRVMPAFARFVGAFPTIEALAEASPADVIRAWAGMGYNQRALRLHRAGQYVVANGWPRDAASLAQIEGIGPFTAAIIASFALGEAAACVDTNVRRVLGRVFGREDAPAREMQALADAVLHRREPARWNQALMDYGAAVCRPRPKCDACVIAMWCATRDDHVARRAMAAEPRAAYSTKRAPQPRFEETARYARGRIIDALRALPDGRSLSIAQIAGAAGLPEDRIAVFVQALQRDGLLIMQSGRASLPR